MRLADAFVFVAAIGCATTDVRTVPDKDWRTVSSSERSRLDRATTAEVARAEHELALARDEVAQARRLPAALAVVRQAASERDAAERDQLARVDAANAAWARASLAWREERLRAALVRLDLVKAEREAKRAEVIDAQLRGEDSYDVAAFRGQLAQLQERFAVASDCALRSRLQFVRASADLASQKEAYAQLVRGRVTSPPASSRLELTGWAPTPAEGSRRRGLKIVSDSSVYLRRP
jgi:hypothetical protein